MLQNMQKYTQGWVATVLGVLLSLAFVMWGIENYLRGNSKKDFAAKVNGVAISANDVNDSFQRFMLKLKQQAGDGFVLNQVAQQQVKTQLLNEMILQSVLAQAVSKAGFYISPVQTVTLIKQLPQFQENGQFSKERFEQIISKLSYTRQTFLADVTETLMLNQLVSGIVGSSFVLPNELAQTIAVLEQRRDIKYIIIPGTTSEKPIPHQEVAQYYQQHQNEFYAPEKIQLEYVELSIDDIKKKIQITEQDLSDYFNGNPNAVKTNNQEIQKAKEAIAQQKAEQEFLTLSDKLTDLTYTNPNTLETAANALGLKIVSTDYFAKEGGETTLTKNPKVLNAVFTPEFIKSNTNSNPIELASGKVVVVRLKNHQASAPLPLPQVQDKITKQLLAVHAAAEAKEKGAQLLNKIHSPADFGTVLATSGYTIFAKKAAIRAQPGVDKAILQAAFAIPAHSKQPFKGLALANGDYVVLSVENIQDLPANRTSTQQKMNFSRVSADLYGKAEYELYIQSQLSRAKIKLPAKNN